MKSFIQILFVALFFSGCASDGAKSADGSGSASASSGTVDKSALEKEISTVENSLYNVDNFSFDPVKAKGVVIAYDRFAENFPDDPKTPDYLFKSGEIHRSLKQYKQAINAYSIIHGKYKSFEKAPHALFLMGFSYENDLKDMGNAKKSYSEFLSKYPNHELAKDVKFSLDNLGRSPEDIIKEFEEKNKK